MSTLDFDTDPFPPDDRYPLNSPSGNVFRWVKQELDAGPTLVVTGFSSLEFLVRTLSNLPAGQAVHILVGPGAVILGSSNFSQAG